jgi:glycosyltransferase involved in cell wall biosynthesis
MSRLTVLQMIPALQSGGAERCVLAVSRGLVQAGHRSLVVSAGGRLTETLLAEGGEHFCLPVGHKSPQLLGTIPALRRIVCRERVSVVDAHSRLPAWLAWLLFRTLRAQDRPGFVTTVHGLNSPGFYSRVMLRGDVVAAVSETVRAHLRRMDPSGDQSHVRVIPRGVSAAEFPWGWKAAESWCREFEQQFPQIRGKHLLTLPGRLTRSKGHADLLHLLRMLMNEGPTVHGLIVGDTTGRERYVAELRRLADSLGVSHCLTFTGYRSDVREIYSVSSAVLSLSAKPESFGLTVAEALSLGVPVIAYAHGGVAEILQEAFPAGAVEPGNPESLADRVRLILSSFRGPITGGLPMALRPSQFRFDEAAMVAGTLEMYEGLPVKSNL